MNGKLGIVLVVFGCLVGPADCSRVNGQARDLIVSADEHAMFVQRQVRLTAFGLIENAMSLRHRMSEVVSTDVESLVPSSTATSGHRQYKFSGTAESRWRLSRENGDRDQFAGELSLKIDSFGRVVDYTGQVEFLSGQPVEPRSRKRSDK